MNLSLLLNSGINDIMKTASRYYLKSREGRALVAQMLPRMQAGAAIRNRYEKQGIHIPTFLIASIASQCNLHCHGCYARANGACGETDSSQADMSAEKWVSIFAEAVELGIPFVLLAGGEPLLRQDILDIAAANKEIIFPVFTNGTLIDDERINFLDTNRHIIPILSIEGERAETDMRRGEGMYAMLQETMLHLQERGILFGVSITVTNQNMADVTEWNRVSALRDMGCGLLFFVEYVPVSAGTEHLILDSDDLAVMNERVEKLKTKTKDMTIFSFPGDEAQLGGCLAAGRGFFHINSLGGAEPCPFSPYAKHSLQDYSILDILQSDYFAELRMIAQNAPHHIGGCTLFQETEQVKAEYSR